MEIPKFAKTALFRDIPRITGSVELAATSGKHRPRPFRHSAGPLFPKAELFGGIWREFRQMLKNFLLLGPFGLYYVIFMGFSMVGLKIYILHV